MRGKKNKESTEHNRGDVKRSADVPTEVFGYVLKDCKGRIFRTYEEHIDGSSGSIPKNQVYTERYRAEREKRERCVPIIFSGFGKISRHDQINTDKNQQHMPDICVKRERPIAVRDAGWLNKSHETAEQIVRGHKSADPVPDGTRLQEDCDDAQIHRHAAKLERKNPSNVRVVAHIKTIKKLLVYFGQNEKSPNAAEHGFVSSLGKLAQLAGKQNANGDAYERERKVKEAVSRRRCHPSGGSFHEFI